MCAVVFVHAHAFSMSLFCRFWSFSVSYEIGAALVVALVLKVIIMLSFLGECSRVEIQRTIGLAVTYLDAKFSMLRVNYFRTVLMPHVTLSTSERRAG